MIFTEDLIFFFFSSRRRHTRYWRDWSSDVCSSDLQQLVAQAGVERFHVSVLPRAAGRDVGGLGAHGADPGLDRLGHELGAVVRADRSEERRVGKEGRSRWSPYH